MLSAEESLALVEFEDTAALTNRACHLRYSYHRNAVTYSRKVFIPLTYLCRDVCHYCTFAKTPKRIDHAYLSMEQVLELCREGAEYGCQEALFT